MPVSQVCVYCASSPKIDPAYFEATDVLADALVQDGVKVVFGGGATGLMGRLADRVLALGGHITGIMPNFMKEVEWAHKGVQHFHFVGDMHERKKRFLDGTDALIALPGGCGTLEELLEAITLKRLGLFTKPIIILNIRGYYDPLLAMLERSVEEGFMNPQHRQMWTVLDDPAGIIAAIEAAPPWSEEAIRFAPVR
ncbi:LOG family protein [Cesiribacter andamanensis]|uniref:Cytokinin riboside 5'-monophosphate phosphoribohydrolase n=1 Tax=Cesiribacter andamanensis AMV16 TaxID=1279009 RepID=M7NYD8_9BACT|nr:TIGR00730 family Rossman fold protein [Cesiribacter andamanensis]EMR03399.1 LOG family protein yvdD [Cesiribacter andamanensis AMV16]